MSAFLQCQHIVFGCLNNFQINLELKHRGRSTLICLINYYGQWYKSSSKVREMY